MRDPREGWITILGAMAALTAVACSPETTAGGRERVSDPAKDFSVVTGAGLHLAGDEARVDIRYRAVDMHPDVEVFVSASDTTDRIWTVYVIASGNFLETLNLNVPVVERLLKSGEARVNLDTVDDVFVASSGHVELALAAGQLVGEAHGMRRELEAKFKGPFIVTCAVPPSVLARPSPASTSDDQQPSLVVDDSFSTPLCRPFLALGGRRSTP